MLTIRSHQDRDKHTHPSTADHTAEITMDTSDILQGLLNGIYRRAFNISLLKNKCTRLQKTHTQQFITEHTHTFYYWTYSHTYTHSLLLKILTLTHILLQNILIHIIHKFYDWTCTHKHTHFITALTDIHTNILLQKTHTVYHRTHTHTNTHRVLQNTDFPCQHMTLNITLAHLSPALREREQERHRFYPVAYSLTQPIKYGCAGIGSKVREGREGHHGHVIAEGHEMQCPLSKWTKDHRVSLLQAI